MNKIITIIKLAEPKTLAATSLPIFGCITYFNINHLTINLYLTTLIVMTLILMQCTANVYNDYIDVKTGLDLPNPDALKEEKMVYRYNLSLSFVKRTWQIMFFVSIFIGSSLVLITPMPYSIYTLLLAILAYIVIFGYSSGPKPISYTCFGEIVIGSTMGLFIPILFLVVHQQAITLAFLMFCIPMICIVALLLFTNNECDIIKDAKHMRRTLPIVAGYITSRLIRISLLMIIIIWMMINIKYYFSLIFVFITVFISYRSVKLEKSESTKEKNMKLIISLMLIIILFYISLI